MAYAFCLRLDAENEKAVAALWRQLVETGAGEEMVRLGYPPHLTLAVLDDEPPLDMVEAALHELRSTKSFALELGGARGFPDTAITWLAVGGGQALANLHQRLLRYLPEASVREHYRAGRWTPHVTLQMTGDVDRALALVNSVWPICRQARATGLDLVQFPPVRVLGSVVL